MKINMDEAVSRLEIHMTDGQYFVVDRTGEHAISIWATNHLGIELVASNSMRVKLLETEKPAEGPAEDEAK
jgi:hypothetical protein